MSTAMEQRLAAVRAKLAAAKQGATDVNAQQSVPVSGGPSSPQPSTRPADGGTSGPVGDSGATVAATDGASGELLHGASTPQVDHAAGEMVVVTADQLQPTTLVVVERPAAVAVGTSGEQSSTEFQPSTNLDPTNPIHQGFLQRLHDLEVAMLNRDPLMRTHLGEIHKTMINYEEIPNLLTVDEISKIMAAQQQHTNTVLVQTISKAASSKKAPKVTLDDI